jgi:[acyl-carrier-protein] S-malonyltransferase
MPYCLIFPGQGTQFPGMSAGLDLEWTGDIGLLSLMEKGPQDVLTQTMNAQKAVFAVSAALWERSGLRDPAMVMGHSLGEYMALTASGAISLMECYSLVSARASAMDSAMPAGRGAMAAVMGMSAEDIAEVLKDIDGIWVANINTPDQVVISGEAPVMPQAVSLLKGKGARRIIPLNVAVASHCPLMEPARIALREYLKGIEIKRPVSRIVFNAVASEESDPEMIKVLLADQLVSPVRWKSSVRHAAAGGIGHFIEIGPKSVLAPMIKKILPDAKVEVITGNGN